MILVRHVMTEAPKTLSPERTVADAAGLMAQYDIGVIPLANENGALVGIVTDRDLVLRRRSCERWFTRVGLPSPRVVMVLGRLLYAHRLLLDPGYTVEDVALKLGYSKIKTLQMQLRAVFGVTEGELRVSLSTEDALAAVISRYFTQSDQADDAGDAEEVAS